MLAVRFLPITVIAVLVLLHMMSAKKLGNASSYGKCVCLFFAATGEVIQNDARAVVYWIRNAERKLEQKFGLLMMF